MDIVIVDDEALARHRLQRMIDTVPEHQVVGEAKNTREAIELVKRLTPDVVLLDIHMPGGSGLQAAEILSTLEAPPAIIFCTAYDQHALDAFAVNAQDYLLKPVRQEQLINALERSRVLNNAQASKLKNSTVRLGREHIDVKMRGGIELIALKNIYYFEADHKYVTVYHTLGEALIDDTLKELEHEFSDLFVRTHRNALVSVDRIRGLIKSPEGHFCLNLHGCDKSPHVSRRHVGRLRELLSNL